MSAAHPATEARLGSRGTTPATSRSRRHAFDEFAPFAAPQASVAIRRARVTCRSLSLIAQFSGVDGARIAPR